MGEFRIEEGDSGTPVMLRGLSTSVTVNPYNRAYAPGASAFHQKEGKVVEPQFGRSSTLPASTTLAQPKPSQGIEKLFDKLAAETRRSIMDIRLGLMRTPEHQKRFQEVYDQARAYALKCHERGEKGIFVLDIDETIQDNSAYYTDPQGRYFKKGDEKGPYRFNEATWQEFTGSNKPKIFPQAKEFIAFLNEIGMPYTFITSMSAKNRDVLIQRLEEEAGVPKGMLDKPGHLYFVADGESKLEYQKKASQALGLPILASLGDQPRDMTEDPSKNFLLPNTLYELSDAKTYYRSSEMSNWLASIMTFSKLAQDYGLGEKAMSA